MRFASVDNRSRMMWLLAGLGVLIWAVLSVLFGGSSAHAAETPGQPAHAQSEQHAQPPQRSHASHAQPQRSDTHPQRQSASPQKRVAVEKTTAQKTTAVQKTTATKISEAAEQTPLAHAVQRPAHRLADQRIRDRHPAHVRGMHHPSDARHDARHADRAQHADRARHDDRARHADRHVAAAPAVQPASAQHPSPAPVRAVPAVQKAAIVATVTSERPAENSPEDSHGANPQHPLSTPPTLSSGTAGPSASAGVLPGTADPADVLGPLLTATHADDDVLPSGPVGTPDDSPD